MLSTWTVLSWAEFISCQLPQRAKVQIFFCRSVHGGAAHHWHLSVVAGVCRFVILVNLVLL